MASPRAGTFALDSTEDADLLARLRCVVCSGAVAQSSGLDPVAPFIDFKTLLRLHNLIEDHTTPEERGSKKAALAYFVMDVTLPLPRKLPLDVGLAEAAGNAMDREVARYGAARKKAEHALRVSEGRAASKKRQRGGGPAAEEAPAAPADAAPAVQTATAVELLDRAVYTCEYGSTPLPPGVLPKAVPPKQSHRACPLCPRLQAEVQALKARLDGLQRAVDRAEERDANAQVDKSGAEGRLAASSAWSKRRLGSATARHSCFLRPALLALGCTPHSEGAALPLSTQWEAAARAPASAKVANSEALTIQATSAAFSALQQTSDERLRAAEDEYEAALAHVHLRVSECPDQPSQGLWP